MALGLPLEVMHANVLPHLDWNELLSLRQVCRTTKDTVDNYMRRYPALAPEIQIDEDGDKTMEEFLTMGIISTRIFFNNSSGDAFYERLGQRGTDFIQRYAHHLRHLRVTHLSCYSTGAERRFMESIRNIESLEAEYYRQGRNQEDAFRLTFNDLRKLKIHHYDHPANLEFGDALRFVGENLEHLMISPRLQNVPEFEAFLRWLEELPRGNLTVDLGGFQGLPELPDRNDHTAASLHFVNFCAYARRNGMKLVNVRSTWLRVLYRIRTPMRIPMGQTFTSVINFHPWMVHVNLSRMETLEIRDTWNSCVGIDNDDDAARPNWPALKTLKVTVNSEFGRYFIRDGARNTTVQETTYTSNLLRFLFTGTARPSVTVLRLNFIYPVIPDANSIVSSCFNLKILHLTKWPGTNDSIAQFFTGLLQLQEIHLDSCDTIDDATLSGLANVRRLESLGLKRLDKMVRITDILFATTIRHLPLKQLIITSELPIQSVTMGGIESLLEGAFAVSIENFKFTGWTLDGVPPEDFENLKMRFRCNY